MGFLTKLLSLFEVIKKILDFVQTKIQEKNKKQDRKNVIDLSENTEKNIKEGNLDEINKNIM